MRVVRNTPDQLVIAYRPWGWGLFTAMGTTVALGDTIYKLSQGNIQGLLNLLVIALLLLFAYLYVRQVWVVFDEPSHLIKIFETTLISRSRTTYRLDEISKAALATDKTPKTLTMTQIQLVIPEGERAGHHAITRFKELHKHNYANIAAVINAWLDSVRARS